LRSYDDLFIVYCDPKATEQVKQALDQDEGITVESADLEWVAKTAMDLDESQSAKALQFLDILDDHDDVQNVYTNLA